MTRIATLAAVAVLIAVSPSQRQYSFGHERRVGEFPFRVSIIAI
jgi:hypothetical protein